MKYGTIYADPPWLEAGGGVINRGAQRHYPLMKTAEIRKITVADMAQDDAHLYLWTTNNFLEDALGVVKAWGFRYVTMVTWVKDRFGIGQYYRGATEHCLFGVRGNPGYKQTDEGKRAQGMTVIMRPKGPHSWKPPEMRTFIEKVSPGPYLEMFARDHAEGWDVWGNQVENSVEIGADT